MKRSAAILCILTALLLPATASAFDDMASGDRAFDEGTFESFKKAGDIYAKIADRHTDSYEANWKASMAYRWYTETARQDELDGWKKLSSRYGKIGMEYARRAIELNPEGVEGHFWYGSSVASVADGSSIFTAIKRGFKSKTQKSFEKSYEIDKMYMDAGPVIALARYWFVLPKIAGGDKKKALVYMREAYSYFPDDPEVKAYLGEMLIRNKDTRNQGISLLRQAASAEGFDYFNRYAKNLLENG